MPEDIKKQLALINRQVKETDAVYHALAARMGLSDCVFWVLYLLCESEQALTQYDLANEWFYPKQTIHSAVGKLRQSGYVDLRAVPGTRGRKTIHLTQAGEAFCKRHIRTVLAAEEKALGRLSEEERRTYISLAFKHLGFLKEEAENL